jgi:hypothetical protein
MVWCVVAERADRVSSLDEAAVATTHQTFSEAVHAVLHVVLHEAKLHELPQQKSFFKNLKLLYMIVGVAMDIPSPSMVNFHFCAMQISQVALEYSRPELTSRI